MVFKTTKGTSKQPENVVYNKQFLSKYHAGLFEYRVVWPYIQRTGISSWSLWPKHSNNLVQEAKYHYNPNLLCCPQSTACYTHTPLLQPSLPTHHLLQGYRIRLRARGHQPPKRWLVPKCWILGYLLELGHMFHDEMAHYYPCHKALLSAPSLGAARSKDGRAMCVTPPVLQSSSCPRCLSDHKGGRCTCLVKQVCIISLMKVNYYTSQKCFQLCSWQVFHRTVYKTKYFSWIKPVLHYPKLNVLLFTL